MEAVSLSAVIVISLVDCNSDVNFFSSSSQQVSLSG